jgi:hypothetical protein
MTLGELLHVLRDCCHELDKLERLKDVCELLVADAHLVAHSHHTFLPAARDYLRSSRHADYRFRAARVRRARLGGASRWLYQHQKRTFETAVRLLSPVTVPQTTIDAAWTRIRAAESRLMARARKRKALADARPAASGRNRV